MADPPELWRFHWGNNERRAELKDRTCIILAEGNLNTVLVQFLDTGEKITTSRRALRPHPSRAYRRTP